MTILAFFLGLGVGVFTVLAGLAIGCMIKEGMGE